MSEFGWFGLDFGELHDKVERLPGGLAGFLPLVPLVAGNALLLFLGRFLNEQNERTLGD
jgi:hypothetical protein